jgi:hypothetical protein
MRVKLDRAASRLEDAIVSLERESADGDGVRQVYEKLRSRFAQRSSLFAERIKELLVAGPFVLQQAVRDLKAVLKEDACDVCAVPAGSPAAIAIARGIDDAFSELALDVSKK